jgi:hypothetical protein
MSEGDAKRLKEKTNIRDSNLFYFSSDAKTELMI